MGRRNLNQSCLGCGRDTSARDGFCVLCRSGSSHILGKSRGDKVLPMSPLGGDPADDDNDDDFDSDKQYHG